jgi:hypothetical protein
LLRRWFGAEALALAFLNMFSSFALFAFALTMTITGMRLVVALNLASTLAVAFKDALPYAGFSLIAGGALKAVQTAIAHRNDSFSKIVGFTTALLPIAGGVWLEVTLGYASFVPWMFRPIRLLAGGEATIRIETVNLALVGLFRASPCRPVRLPACRQADEIGRAVGPAPLSRLFRTYRAGCEHGCSTHRSICGPSSLCFARIFGHRLVRHRR